MSEWKNKEASEQINQNGGAETDTSVCTLTAWEVVTSGNSFISAFFAPKAASLRTFQTCNYPQVRLYKDYIFY